MSGRSALQCHIMRRLRTEILLPERREGYHAGCQVRREEGRVVSFSGETQREADICCYADSEHEETGSIILLEEGRGAWNKGERPRDGSDCGFFKSGVTGREGSDQEVSGPGHLGGWAMAYVVEL